MSAIVTKEQILAGNAKLADVRKRVDELNKNTEELAKFLDPGNETAQKMKTVRRGLFNRFRELKINIPVVGLIFNGAEKKDEAKNGDKDGDSNMSTTSDDLKSGASTPNTATISKDARPRYRFQQGPERRKLKLIAEKIEIVDDELELQEEVLMETALENGDIKLVRFVVELKDLQNRFKNDLERLQGQISITGFVFNKTNVTEYRTKLLAEKIQLENEVAKIKEDAEAEYIRTVDEAKILDRELKYLVKDINDAPVCYKEINGEFPSAEDTMDRVSEAQRLRTKKEFLRVTDIFTYSHRKGCVVWCKGKKLEDAPGRKWDFYRYYEPCTRDEAVRYFAMAGGKDVAPPIKKSGKESEYTTMIL